ncbi:MAG: hypothetical protein NZM27_03845 [Acetobacteraceae bacterium]|nr:hypothetical protein [Acetobacteraceae bacterium]MCX7685196.1 hypothetical protein [Acetobacteraceae bacterium]
MPLAAWADALAVPGLPAWSGVVVLALLAVVALAYLLMPFAVFGLKGRLDRIEAQIEELAGEVRTLSQRLALGPRVAAAEDFTPHPAVPPAVPRDPPPPPRVAPVPPPPVRGERAEPRLDVPRPPGRS